MVLVSRMLTLLIFNANMVPRKYKKGGAIFVQDVWQAGAEEAGDHPGRYVKTLLQYRNLEWIRWGL
jgi:hypothetical protein